MPSLDVIRTLTLRGRQDGLDQLAGALAKVSQAQERVEQTSAGMTTTTDTSARKLRTIEGAYDRWAAAQDPVLRGQRALDAEFRRVTAALDVGHISMERYIRDTELLQGKLQQLGSMHIDVNVDQSAFNRPLGVNDNGKSARDSAAVFEQAARDADHYAARLAAVQANIDPLAAAQDRYNAELAEYSAMAQRGDLRAEQFAKAQLLAKSRLDATTASLNAQAAAMRRSTDAAASGAHQTANLAAQFQDIGVTAAMGMSPMMIALQQGTQISAELNRMQNPARGLASAFTSIINPVSLLTIGFIALGAAAIQWFMGAQAGAEDAKSALEEHDKWLDEILVGYAEIREAAKNAADAANMLPKDAVKDDLRTDIDAKEEERAAALDRIADAQARVNEQIDLYRLAAGGVQGLVPIDTEYFDALVGLQQQFLEIDLSAASSLDVLNDFRAQLTDIKNASEEHSIVRGVAEDFLVLVENARDANSLLEGSKAGLKEALAFDLADDLDVTGQKMQSLASISGDLASWQDQLKFAADAAAWAIRNSGDAAVVAAGQYGTAAGAAGAYANALWTLGNMIPQVAAAQAAMVKMRGAETAYNNATEAAGNLLRLGSIGRAEYNDRLAETKLRFDQAKDSISGLTDATKALDDAERQATIGSMPAREAAAARIQDRYAELEAQLKASGAGEAEFARLTSSLTMELDASGQSFDQMAAKAGGAGKALRAAEKDFNSFISTADKLGEKLFPAEYARKEAAELSALLDQYRGKLDSFQIAGVQKEIGNLNTAADLGLRNLEDRADEAGDEIMKTLGSALSSLFDGPMDDADAFFDKLLSGFASIGQANLSKGFESLFGGGANGNQPDAMGAITAAVSQGAEIGTEKGTTTGWEGLDSLFGGKQGAGLQGAMGIASAGLGGLGIGYQTQDPLMGAIGGAMSGFAAGAAMGGMGGPIGAIVGGIAGLLGGMMGNNKALKEAKEALDKNRGAIENLIAKGMGTGIGQNQQAYNQFQDEAEKGISAAEKAKDWNTAYRLEQSVISFRSILEKDFLTSFDGMLEAMQSGLGANSPFAQAQASVVALREELKSFAADAAFFGASADTARWASQQYALSLLTGAKELTKFEDEVGKVEGTASALQLTLEQLNMSSDAAAKAINTGVLAAMHKLRAEFQDDLGRSLNDLSGAGYLNDIADAQIKYSERVRDAKALGLDSGGAFEELSLSLRNIVRDAGLTDAQLTDLAKTFPQFADAFTGTLAGDAQSRVDRARSDLQAAYDAEATAIQTVIDQLTRSIDSLGDFKASLRLDTNLSPLGARDRLEEAQSQYQQVVADAMGGDQEAIGKVEAVSRQYLDDARSYYASSENYFKIFEDVESTLDGVLSKASTQLSAADQQLAALKSQAGYLIDINVSVLSVADAITGLELAQAAQTKAIADTIASGAGGYSDQIKSLYQNVLGRDPDPAGAGYWQGQINAGVGGDQLIRDFLSGAKAAGQIDMVPQALRDQYGFKAGGFTGYGGVDQMAGIVHGQEFVAHAQATRAYRPQLEAMNAGSYRPGNDNSSKEIVAALRSEIGELRNELRRIGSVIVQSDEATRGKIEKGNAELAAVSDGIKRVIAA